MLLLGAFSEGLVVPVIGFIVNSFKPGYMDMPRCRNFPFAWGRSRGGRSCPSWYYQRRRLILPRRGPRDTGIAIHNVPRTTDFNARGWGGLFPEEVLCVRAAPCFHPPP